jgi:hypothetical protein
MQHSNRWRAPTLLLIGALALGVPACGRAPAAADGEGASSEARVERVEGTDQSRVILTQQAAERLGIQTAEVRDVPMAAKPAAIRQRRGPAAIRQRRGPAAMRKTIPYAAVLYDEHGDTWAYTSPTPLTFIRKQIGVDYVSGDLAVLINGPPAGTRVVTIGAAELLGAELGVGGE